jgi:hypothetical protein
MPARRNCGAGLPHGASNVANTSLFGAEALLPAINSSRLFLIRYNRLLAALTMLQCCNATQNTQ